jgi:hypothetical protein
MTKKYINDKKKSVIKKKNSIKNVKTKKHFVKNINSKYSRINNQNNGFRFVRLDKLPYPEYIKYSRMIIDIKKIENIPLLGFWKPKLLETLRKLQNTYVILEYNKLIGIIIFKNMTQEFRNNMMGKLGNIFTTKVDINSYFFYYSILNKSKEDEIITKKNLDTLFEVFIKSNNLQNKNFVIILLQFLQLQIYNLDIVNKYKPIVEYVLHGTKKIKKLGFEYNGYHINLNNDIINVFMKRYIKSSANDFNNYYPLYIITRQLDNDNASKISNLEMFLNKEGLYTVNNVYKYCLNNTLVYFTNVIDNDIYSMFKSIPYDSNFVINYITNELGNNHIICNYAFLYNALVDYYGENSKEISNFAKILNNLDDAYNLLDQNNKIVIIRNFDIATDFIVLYKIFNNTSKFREYCNNINQLLYGYYILDMSYYYDLIKSSNNFNYVITKVIVFTYIDKELKLYIGNKGGLGIFNKQLNDYFSDTKVNLYSTKYMIFPDDYKDFIGDSITSKDVDKLSDLIRENCIIIGKMYKHHVTNDINQINGFRSIFLYMKPIKVNGQYKVIIQNTAYFNNLSNQYNYEHIDWLNEIAIKPALYKGYKTPRIEPHYHPVSLD